MKGWGKEENTIELVDECDCLILDTKGYDEVHASVGTFIGFTATPLMDADYSSERDLM